MKILQDTCRKGDKFFILRTYFNVTDGRTDGRTNEDDDDDDNDDDDDDDAHQWLETSWSVGGHKEALPLS